MAIQADGSAPYAPPKAVMEVINRYRDKGLTVPFDLDVLIKAGVTEALAPRVLQALRLLDLVDEGGHPTEAFERLKVVPSDDFRDVLGEIVRSSYAEVFNFVDPAEDSPTKVADAFRTYKPTGQRNRMVTLFLGLCREAGIIEGTPERQRASVNGARLPADQRVTRQRPATPRRTQYKARGTVGVPPQIEALLDTLPRQEEGWTKARRDHFVAAFNAILDYTYPLREQLPSGSDAEDEGGRI